MRSVGKKAELISTDGRLVYETAHSCPLAQPVLLEWRLDFSSDQVGHGLGTTTHGSIDLFLPGPCTVTSSGLLWLRCFSTEHLTYDKDV